MTQSEFVPSVSGTQAPVVLATLGRLSAGATHLAWMNRSNLGTFVCNSPVPGEALASGPRVGCGAAIGRGNRIVVIVT